MLKKQQMDRLGVSGMMAHSQILGTMAQGMGAKLSATLHHRGEHEVGGVTVDGAHVYVPRAQWSQSHDHPLKGNNATWNEQHFVADELKRQHGEAKRKEYYKREVDRQLQERSDARTRMNNDKQEFATLVGADADRHNKDQLGLKAEARKGNDLLRQHLGQQNADLSRRAQENRVREAQEAAEVKMRTVQQMCEELAETGRKKKQANLDLQQGMLNAGAKANQAKADKHKEDEKMRREIREALMQDEYRLQATQQRVAAAQDHGAACVAVYERTTGKANREKEAAETLRMDNDEKKHLMRTDAFYAQRERARERQRQNFVNDLDRQMAAVSQKASNAALTKQADREAIQAASKRSLDQELDKAKAKRAEEMQLQQELRIMMAEKEIRDSKEDNAGYSKPASISTMNICMSLNGNAVNKISDLHKSMEASRYIGKPMGRAEGEGRMPPLDASPARIRQLTKDRYKGEVPISSVLGGVVGTLGGGGGGIQTALMAMGGPFLPRTTGLAVQDRKLASAWYENVHPEAIENGRREAGRRERAKAVANHD